MDRQRIGRPAGTQSYHTQLLRAMGLFLPRKNLSLQSPDRRVRRTPSMLVSTAILMAWRPAGRMLPALPDRTMLLMDAGFTGYDLLTTLNRSGHHFILRVGRNVRLLRKLGWHFNEHDGIVYPWPQAHRDQPPLVLRLVVVGDGRSAVYLVSSVLGPTRLRDRQIARWYRLRWGLEVFYRGLKQTLYRHKMRSVRPNNALTELDWAVAGVWMLGLMTVRQIPRTVRWSVAPAFRVVRRVMSRPHARGPKLRRLLRRAVQDTDVRRHGKTARNRPHKKTDPPAPPNIRVATRSEIRRAQGLKRCARRNALTALGGTAVPPKADGRAVGERGRRQWHPKSRRAGRVPSAPPRLVPLF